MTAPSAAPARQGEAGDALCGREIGQRERKEGDARPGRKASLGFPPCQPQERPMRAGSCAPPRSRPVSPVQDKFEGAALFL